MNTLLRRIGSWACAHCLVTLLMSHQGLWVLHSAARGAAPTDGLAEIQRLSDLALAHRNAGRYSDAAMAFLEASVLATSHGEQEAHERLVWNAAVTFEMAGLSEAARVHYEQLLATRDMQRLKSVREALRRLGPPAAIARSTSPRKPVTPPTSWRTDVVLGSAITGGLGLGLGIAGIVVADGKREEVRGASDEWGRLDTGVMTFETASALRAQADSWTVAAFVGFAVATTGAIVAIAVAVTGDAPPRTTLTLEPLRHGVQLGIHTSF